jgi:Anti-sigma factor NepR
MATWPQHIKEWGMHIGGKDEPDENKSMKLDTSGPNRESEKRPATDIQDAIGQRLKTMYRHIVHEPVPENLLQLLAELEAREQSK